MCRNVFDTRIEPEMEAVDNEVIKAVQHVNGVTQLKFTRPRNTSDDRPLTSAVYLIFAWGGSINYQTRSIGQHAVANRAVSAENFTFPDSPTECPCESHKLPHSVCVHI